MLKNKKTHILDTEDMGFLFLSVQAGFENLPIQYKH